MPSDFEDNIGRNKGAQDKSSTSSTHTRNNPKHADTIIPNLIPNRTSIPPIEPFDDDLSDISEAGDRTQANFPLKSDPNNDSKFDSKGGVNFAALIGEARKNLQSGFPKAPSHLNLDLKKARDEVERNNKAIEEIEDHTRIQIVEEMVGEFSKKFKDSEAIDLGDMEPSQMEEEEVVDPYARTSISTGTTEALFGFSSSDPEPSSATLTKSHSTHKSVPKRPEFSLKRKPPAPRPAKPLSSSPSYSNDSKPPSDKAALRPENSMVQRINNLPASSHDAQIRSSQSRGTSGVLRLPDGEILDLIGVGPSGPYRIRVDELEYGPTDASVIVRLIEKGLITGADEISKSAWGGWQRLEVHPLFISFLEKPFDRVLEEDSKIQGLQKNSSATLFESSHTDHLEAGTTSQADENNENNIEETYHSKNFEGNHHIVGVTGSAQYSDAVFSFTDNSYTIDKPNPSFYAYTPNNRKLDSNEIPEHNPVAHDSETAVLNQQNDEFDKIRSKGSIATEPVKASKEPLHHPSHSRNHPAEQKEHLTEVSISDISFNVPENNSHSPSDLPTRAAQPSLSVLQNQPQPPKITESPSPSFYSQTNEQQVKRPTSDPSNVLLGTIPQSKTNNDSSDLRSTLVPSPTSEQPKNSDRRIATPASTTTFTSPPSLHKHGRSESPGTNPARFDVPDFGKEESDRPFYQSSKNSASTNYSEEEEETREGSVNLYDLSEHFEEQEETRITQPPSDSNIEVVSFGETHKGSVESAIIDLIDLDSLTHEVTRDEIVQNHLNVSDNIEQLEGTIPHAPQPKHLENAKESKPEPYHSVTPAPETYIPKEETVDPLASYDEVASQGMRPQVGTPKKITPQPVSEKIHTSNEELDKNQMTTEKARKNDSHSSEPTNHLYSMKVNRATEREVDEFHDTQHLGVERNIPTEKLSPAVMPQIENRYSPKSAILWGLLAAVIITSGIGTYWYLFAEKESKSTGTNNSTPVATVDQTIEAPSPNEQTNEVPEENSNDNKSDDTITLEETPKGTEITAAQLAEVNAENVEYPSKETVAMKDETTSINNGSDYRLQRMEILSKLAKNPSDEELQKQLQTLIEKQAKNPDSPTELTRQWEPFKQVGTNPLVLRTKDPDGIVWEFIPEHTKGPTWRAEYAFYQLCSVIDCGFKVPETRLATVSKNTFVALDTDDNISKVKTNKDGIHGVLRHVIPNTIPFQIEEPSIWRTWLSRRTAITSLETTIQPVDFDGGSDLTKTSLSQLAPTVSTVAEGVANILGADYLTNNFGRFARHRSDYGRNVRFVNSPPFVLYAIANKDAFQARESTRVRGRFFWSDRIGKRFLESLRRLDPEYVNELFFPNITGAEKVAMGVFWEQRSDLLKTIDERIKLYGEENIIFE